MSNASAILYLLLLSWLVNSSSFRPRSVNRRIATSVIEDNKIGGIYQYNGPILNGKPPKEIMDLLQQEKSPRRNRVKSPAGSSSKKHFAQPIEAIEREVNKMYASAHFSSTDAQDDDGTKYVGNFKSQNSVAIRKIKSANNPAQTSYKKHSTSIEKTSTNMNSNTQHKPSRLRRVKAGATLQDKFGGRSSSSTTPNTPSTTPSATPSTTPSTSSTSSSSTGKSCSGGNGMSSSGRIRSSRDHTSTAAKSQSARLSNHDKVTTMNNPSNIMVKTTQSYRLRPPPPVPPHIAQKKAERESLLLTQAKQKERQREETRVRNKALFEPFSFNGLSNRTDNTVNTTEFSAIAACGSFESLGFSNNKALLRNLHELRMENPTAIQALSIPVLLRSEDAVLQAQTGSGKTLAYLLPLIRLIDTSRKEVQGLVLAPSRELVQQIGQVAAALFKDTGMRVQTLIGGANVQSQVLHLRDERPHLLIATPGRLGELVFHLEKLRLNGLRALVVDEVDNMLQEPYIQDIETLLEVTPFQQRMLFQAQRRNALAPSDATLDSKKVTPPTNIPQKLLMCLASATSKSEAVNAFADQYCGEGNWHVLSVSGDSAIPSSITHGLISSPKDRSLGLLKRFLSAKPAVRSALIFVNDPRRVVGLCRDLEIAGIIAAPLHGDTNKDDRKEIIARIKDGRLKLVVATELAARGLDIPELTHVINYELPTDAQHYVHRTGRCGRAGRKGLVMNFANPDTKFVVRRFGKQLGVKVRDCELRNGRVFLN